MRKKHNWKFLICVMLLLLSLLITSCGKGGGPGEMVDAGSDDIQMATTKPESAEETRSIETQGNSEIVSGKVFSFDKDNPYKFSTALRNDKSNPQNTYGTFSISSSDKLVLGESKNGVPVYKTTNGKISIRYNYSQKMMNLPAEEWQLEDDGNSSVDVFKLDKNIQRGAIVLQKSMDHLNWYDISVQTNAFIDTPVQNGVLYETTDMEMINGCYYRLLVMYRIKRKTGTSNIAWVIPRDDYEFKRIAEVYEFYAEYENEHIEALPENANRYSLGKTVLVSDYASYSGEKPIDKGDLHYGWDLGNFFVSGFTSKTTELGETVFLKNVGDVVTLWFNLKQNISALNNDKSLTIEADSDGYDSYFQTPATYFGRGMLIIRYTDYENVKHDPVMYFDYLRANTVMGADTRVQLFEEGDYEVALDYEVKKSQLLSQNHHYRTFFKFAVRNANCMVYPFDAGTGEELTNKAVTPYGFYLDLAKSRYLDIYIRKEIWTEGADGLTEDTRFNTAAKENQEYTDEGIYTITAKNRYTGLETEKKIYVGTNRILMAHMNSNYSIAEIQHMIEQGATVYEDGTIEMPPETPIPTIEPTDKPALEPPAESAEGQNLVSEPSAKDSENTTRSMSETTDGKGLDSTVIIAIVASAACAVAAVISYRKKHMEDKVKPAEEQEENQEEQQENEEDKPE